jgi:hypothetical protein
VSRLIFLIIPVYHKRTALVNSVIRVTKVTAVPVKITWCKKKGIVHVRAITAYGGSRGIVPLTLNLGCSFTNRPLYHRERTPDTQAHWVSTVGIHHSLHLSGKEYTGYICLTKIYKCIFSTNLHYT